MMLRVITRARREAKVTVRLNALAQAVISLPADPAAARRLVMRYGRAIGATLGLRAVDLVRSEIQSTSTLSIEELDGLLFDAERADVVIARYSRSYD